MYCYLVKKCGGTGVVYSLIVVFCYRHASFAELDRRADDLMSEIERLRVQKADIMSQIENLTREACEVQRRMEACLSSLEQVKAEVQEARYAQQTESDKENLMKFE